MYEGSGEVDACRARVGAVEPGRLGEAEKAVGGHRAREGLGRSARRSCREAGDSGGFVGVAERLSSALSWKLGDETLMCGLAAKPFL